MKYKYLLHIFAAALALLGWFKPSPLTPAFTYAFIIVVVLVLFFQVLASFRDSQKSQALGADVTHMRKVVDRKPHLQVALNGSILSGQDSLVIAKSNDVYPLEFRMTNIGNATADNIQVQFQTPDLIKGLQLGKHWIDHGLIEEAYIPTLNRTAMIRQHSFIAPVTINPGNSLLLGHGKASGLAETNSVLLKIRVSCQDQPDKVYNITMTFLLG